MEQDICYEADVAIVGGGIAGCTLAMALAASYKVVLIDKLDEPAERVGECLAPAARRILRKLDLLHPITEHQGGGLYLPGFGTRSYWGSDMLHVVDHLKNPDGPGWHLNRKAFESYLREEAVTRGVKCLWGMKLYKSGYEAAQWKLTLQSNTGGNLQQVAAKFVVDASGRSSAFAKQAGAGKTSFDKLVAHWAVMPDVEAMKMSTISAAENGWWYSAPLPGSKRVMAMHTDPDLVEKDAARDPDWFLVAARANKDMAAIIANVPEGIHYQGVVTANSTRLNEVAGKQWAAVGDAAMSFDPLSSQGMFNAMAGALQLADLLLATGDSSLDDPAGMERLHAEYGAQMDSIWNRYLQHKDLFYKQEQRWKDAAFWRRRA